MFEKNKEEEAGSRTPTSEVDRELQEEEDDLAIEEIQPFSNISTTAAGVLDEKTSGSDSDEKASIKGGDGVITTMAVAPEKEGEAGTSAEPEDEGPPLPPYSRFTHRQKICITLTVSFLAIISPLSGQIYLPALNSLATDLHVPVSSINLTITTFMVSSLMKRPLNSIQADASLDLPRHYAVVHRQLLRRLRPSSRLPHLLLHLRPGQPWPGPAGQLSGPHRAALLPEHGQQCHHLVEQRYCR